MPTSITKTADHIGVGDILFIDAPASTVFDILRTVSDHPRIFRTCEKVHSIASHELMPGTVATGESREHSRVTLGSRYEATILFGSTRYNYTTSVTRCHEEPDKGRYELSLAGNLGWCTITTTEIVRQVNDKQCQLTSTSAIVPNNFRGTMYMRVLGRRLLRDSIKVFKLDAEDIIAEVNRRNLAETQKTQTSLVPC